MAGEDDAEVAVYGGYVKGGAGGRDMRNNYQWGVRADARSRI
jgi:hypothetical protein